MRYIIVYLIVVAGVQASEGAVQPSARDLIYPAINFSIFAIFLFWKLRGILRNKFKEYHSEVKSHYERATNKDREAQIKLETARKKMETVQGDLKRIETDVDDYISKFDASVERETREQTERMLDHANERIENEKNMIINGIYNEVVSSVVDGAREDIGKSKDLRERTADKLMTGLL